MAEYTIPTRETAPEKCPTCAGKLGWDATVGALRCESCGATLNVAAPPGARIVEHDLMAELAASRPKGRLGAGARQMRCSECGAVVEFGEHETAKKCDFCDSPAVRIEEAADDRYLPESLVPFAIGRDQAIASFKGWLGKLWFRPSNLKEKASVSELHGVYIPYWTFDADVTSDWSADAGYYYYETEHYTVTVNGKTESRTRQVRKVRWEPASGRRHDHHDDHLVCASKGLPEDLARPMANFEIGVLLPYARELLQGFSAESYAIDLPDAWVKGQAGIAAIQEARCSRDVPGDTQRNLRVSNRYANSRFKHVLLPVWIAAFRYNDEVFQFLVNGQTGKVSGRAPWSWLKITLFVLLLVAIGVGIFVLTQRR